MAVTDLSIKANTSVIVCNLCRSKNISFWNKIFDYEYDLSIYGNYFFCKKCCTIFRDKNKFNLKKLYNQNIYIPTSNNLFYNFLKKLYSNFEAKKILRYYNISSNDKILDIGCGNAYLLRSLANLNLAKYYGIDFNVKFKSNKNIKIFKKNLKKFKLIEKINPKVIIINNFFEHFEDTKQIRNFLNKLKSKTIIIIFTPDFNSNGRKIFRQYWSGYHAPRHNFIFSEKSFIFIEKIFSVQIKHISKLYDPFTNIISIKNKINYLLSIKKYLHIFFDFPLIIRGLFSDLKNYNRLFIVLEKK